MLRDIAIAAGLFFVLASLSFPLFYIIKPGYIGAAIMIGTIILILVLPPFFRFLAEHLTAITGFITSLSTTVLYLSGAAISIGFYLISWMVSQIIYQNKIF